MLGFIGIPLIKAALNPKGKLHQFEVCPGEEYNCELEPCPSSPWGAWVGKLE